MKKQVEHLYTFGDPEFDALAAHWRLTVARGVKSLWPRIAGFRARWSEWSERPDLNLRGLLTPAESTAQCPSLLTNLLNLLRYCFLGFRVSFLLGEYLDHGSTPSPGRPRSTQS